MSRVVAIARFGGVTRREHVARLGAIGTGAHMIPRRPKRGKRQFHRTQAEDRTLRADYRPAAVSAATVSGMAVEVTEVELMLKRKNRLAEERKAADFRGVEAGKRAEATRLRGLAASARSPQMAKMRATDAQRLESEADRCHAEAARADERARRFALDEQSIQVRLAHAAPSAALGRDTSDWQIT